MNRFAAVWIAALLAVADGCCSDCNTGCPRPTSWFCGSGCGDVYYNDWQNSPPQCEPCDDCGNWVGHGQSDVWYQQPHAGMAVSYEEEAPHCEHCGH